MPPFSLVRLFWDFASYYHFQRMLLLAYVVAAAAVVTASPGERHNGVISTVYREDFPLERSDQHHFAAVRDRGCPDCDSLFRRWFPLHPNPHHLDERRGLAKRSPKKFKIIGKKSFKGISKGGKKGSKGFGFAGKNIGKSFKPGSPQNFGKKFGKKNLGKAFKPGTPQNKKAKGKGKKGGKKAKKGGKKGGKKAKKGAKKSSPISVPALGLGAPTLGGGSLAFGVPGTGFAGFVVPGAAQAGFDYITG